MHHFTIRCVALLCLITCTILIEARPVFAWHAEGHMLIAGEAARHTPEDVPAFFREGSSVVAHLSIDPDVYKSRDTPELRSTESPEHYFDLEYLGGRALPANRYAFYRLCNELGLNPMHVGVLPYTILEWQHRLTLAFAEHRAQPESEIIRLKCLFYAGILSHYTADLVMPLHTTLHFDGRANAENKSPHSGIHELVDDLLRHVNAEVVHAQPLPAIEAIDKPWQFILDSLDASHAKVDLIYSFEPLLKQKNSDPMADEALRAFAVDRARTGIHFTATLFHSAWQQSKDVDLDWLDRAKLETHFAPDAPDAPDAPEPAPAPATQP